MIDAGYAAMMARYNRWQNRALYAAADAVGEAARRRDRGAFFGSIHGTLSHLLWGDTIWMSRLAGWEDPGVGIPESAGWGGDWATMSAARALADDRIVDWAETLTEADLAGDLTWFSGGTGRRETRPRQVCIAHVFTHQAHHRGQAHAMLTAAGQPSWDTAVFSLPGEWGGEG